MPKKSKKIEHTEFPEALPTGCLNEIPDAIKEIEQCQDGPVLVMKHLKQGVDVLHACVTIYFAAQYVEFLEGEEDIEAPPKPVLDYLERACRILNMNEVADALQQDFMMALAAFRNSSPELDPTVKKNAHAFDLLMP